MDPPERTKGGSIPYSIYLEPDEPDLRKVDQLSLADKYTHALRVAIPYHETLATMAGRIPVEMEGDTPDQKLVGWDTEARASQDIVACARRVLQLVHATTVLLDSTKIKGWDETKDSGVYRRSPVHLAEWRDIFTHPDFYRRVYSDWVGPVYSDRLVPEILSERRVGRWPSDMRGMRGPPHNIRGTAAMSAEGRGSIQPYKHLQPEMVGHRTVLVPPSNGRHPLARYAHAGVLEAVAIVDAEEEEEEPSEYVPDAVVRLPDTGWYFGGFLPSVIYWAYLGISVRNKLRGQYERGGVAAKFRADLTDVLQDPPHLLGPHLGKAWTTMEFMLDELETVVRVPIPDMIRMPQETLEVIVDTAPRKLLVDGMDFFGITGTMRRAIELKQPNPLHTTPENQPLDHSPPHPFVLGSVHGGDKRVLASLDISQQLAMASVEEEGPEAAGHGMPDFYRIMTTEYMLREMQDEHAGVVKAAFQKLENLGQKALAGPGMAMLAAVATTERYVPLPIAPNPVPVLHIPWTIVRLPETPGDRWFEEIVRANQVVRLGLYDVAIACIETGLAIEEWGRGMSDAQSRIHAAERHRGDVATAALIKRAILSGQSIPGFDGPYQRGFRMDGVFIRDPMGPMGDGFLDYHFPQSETPRIAWPRASDAMRARHSWFRVERMVAVDAMLIHSAEIDERNQWEDSGLELPLTMIRASSSSPFEVPLLHLEVSHLAVPPAHTLPMDVVREVSKQEIKRKTEQKSLLPPEALAILYNGAHLGQFRLKRAARMYRDRKWVVRRMHPWPPISHVTNVSLIRLDTMDLARAPVIRTLQLTIADLPWPEWIRDLFAMPTDVPEIERLESVESMLSGITSHGWADLLKSRGLPPALSPSARMTMTWLSLHRAFFLGGAVSTGLVHEQLFPGTPIGLPPSLIVDKRTLWHYPNLGYVEITDMGLLDIPTGLLSMIRSAQWSLPPNAFSPERGEGPFRRQRKKRRIGTEEDPSSPAAELPLRGTAPPYRITAWNFANNRIESLGADTLLSLVWYNRMVSTKKPTSTAWINVYGNPVTNLIADAARPYGEDNESRMAAAPPGAALSYYYIDQRLDHIWKRAVGRLRERMGEPEESLSFDLRALLYWRSNRERVGVDLSRMIYDWDPDTFHRMMVERSIQSEKEGWLFMI